ncbi:hypothetical protein PR048_021253 [Dryococelus australis]|uniref:Uncharacterized protein n=1 Tax=Dryococelus australis TaxID=614101 RepID=A0ABQ9GXS0_9NEOP|nr:hypothetical protein PR048_021253 [Dryococelus australis]
MHGFCDSSEVGYAAATYLHVAGPEIEVTIQSKVIAVKSPVPAEHWKHVVSVDYPADCATSDLSEPPFLKDPVELWRSSYPLSDTPTAVVLEEQKLHALVAIHFHELATLITHFSSLTKLLRFLLCLFHVQAVSFKDDDLSNLQKGQHISLQLRKTAPFIDSAGVIRVGGRLHHSNITNIWFCSARNIH